MTKNNEFFTIPREEVLNRLPEETIRFYAQSEYLDLATGDLYVSRDLIKENGTIVDNIDYNEGRLIINKLQLKLPSVALMYKVIIPHLKELALQDEELKKILESFAENHEFLEDVIIQPGHQRMVRDEKTFWEELGKQPQDAFALKLRMGKKETAITLPYKIKGTDKEFWDYEVNGSFNLEDLDAFGFPKTLKENEEFNYWGPDDFNRPIGKELYPYGGSPQGQVATIRCKTLDLLLTFRPNGDIQDNLGIRGVKVM